MRPFEDEVNEIMVHYHDVARAHGMERALREAVESNVFTRRECAGLRRRVEELQRQLAGEEVEALDFLWQEYVQADPATLTKDAKELAERVRQKVRVLAGVERLEAECDALRARLAEAEADAGAIEWLQAECEALRARVASLETEVDRHRERANAAALAWEGHQAIDCAIKCAREIESLLGTSDPVEAARAIKALQAERDSLRARLAEVEAQAGAMRKALTPFADAGTIAAAIGLGGGTLIGTIGNDAYELYAYHLYWARDAFVSCSAGRKTAERLRLLEELAEAATAFVQGCRLVDCDVRDDQDDYDKCDACPYEWFKQAVQAIRGGAASGGTEA